MRSFQCLKASCCLLVVAASAFSVQAKVAPIPIENLIKQSDLILLGTVSAVVNVDGVDFAQVEVLETLKGAHRATVFYSAEKLWTCDISTAVKTETALFFFKIYEIGPSFWRNAKQANQLRQSAERLFDVNDLFRLGSDGRGRMPVKAADTGDVISINAGVILPTNFSRSLRDVIDFTRRVG